VHCSFFFDNSSSKSVKKKEKKTALTLGSSNIIHSAEAPGPLKRSDFESLLRKNYILEKAVNCLILEKKAKINKIKNQI
jgi:hypothetical protein